MYMYRSNYLEKTKNKTTEMSQKILLLKGTFSLIFHACALHPTWLEALPLKIEALQLDSFLSATFPAPPLDKASLERSGHMLKDMLKLVHKDIINL